jgi:hypothetical protein
MAMLWDACLWGAETLAYATEELPHAITDVSGYPLLSRRLSTHAPLHETSTELYRGHLEHSLECARVKCSLKHDTDILLWCIRAKKQKQKQNKKTTKNNKNKNSVALSPQVNYTD